MSNAQTAVKALMTYVLVIPVALMLGYMLSDPLQYSTFATVGTVLAILLFPILLRWHHPLLLLTWNMGGTMVFIKGQPEMWMLMVAISLGISIIHRALVREGTFIFVPRVVLPLLAIVAVALVTAKLTEGFGLRTFGGDVYGGKKYIFLVGAVLAYFAITAIRIPPEKAGLAVGLFYLGAMARCLGDMYHFAPAWLEPLFWIFQPTRAPEGQWEQITRLVGVTTAGNALFFFLMVKFGIRGIFLSGRPWRMIPVAVAVAMALSGGFRSALLTIALLFTIQFFLEGMHRTKLLPILTAVGIFGFVLLIPVASKLPFGFQRTLAILQLPVDPIAKHDAQHSTDWRLKLWAAVLPQVPDYLLLGKGYALSRRDYEMSGSTAIKTIDAAQQDLALAGDYHNGPLSVVMPFGLWGVAAFTWFLWAAGRVVYNAYRFGDARLRTINTFLWAVFLTNLLRFTFIYGAFHSDLLTFVGIVGLSVSLNGGAIKRLPEQVHAAEPISQFGRRITVGYVQ